MALEVYINDERIDLKDFAGIGLTFQVGSILNPSSRSGNLSNAFTVPKTQNNTRILGNISNINSSTTIPYQRNSAKIKQDGVEIFSDGFAVVGEVSSEYKITVYSGNVSFFDAIKDKNVSELDFGEHQFVMGNITGSFGGGQDYIYPIVDWGNDTEFLDNTNTQNANALFPLLFVKSIIEKIVDSVGYVLKGTFVNSDSYNRLMLSINQWGYEQEVVDENSFIAYNPTTIDEDLDGVTSPGTTYTYPLDFATSTQPVYDVLTDEYTPNNTYIGNFELVASGTVADINAGASLTVRITIEILEDASVILSDTILYTGLTTTPTDWDLRINVNDRMVYKTSDYSARVTVVVTTNTATYPSANFTMDESFFKYYATKDIRYTADIRPSNFYNINQDTVIKELLNMYSLTVQTNDLTKELFLNSLDELNDNIGSSKDWSNKIDIGKTPSINYRLGSYGQINHVRYKADDDVIGEFADSSFTVNDSTLETEKELITLKSVAVESGLRVINETTPTIPLSNYLGEAFDKKNPRFLLLNQSNKTVNFVNTINSDSATVSTDIPFCYFSESGQSDSLDWSSLLAANYDTLLGMLDQTKLVSAYFLLSGNDVANFDFTIPIYLDVHTPEININGYFYVNKISNFKKGRATKVDLIRL